MLNNLLIRTVPIAHFKKIAKKYNPHNSKYISTYPIPSISLECIEYPFATMYSVEATDESFFAHLSGQRIKNLIVPLSIGNILPVNIQKFIELIEFDNLIICDNDLTVTTLPKASISDYLPTVTPNPSNIALPVNALIGITSYCNLKCTMCDQDKVAYKKHLDCQTIRKRIDFFARFCKQLSLTDFGETFIHPQINEIFIYIIENYENLQVNIITNGVRTLEKAVFEQLISRNMCKTIFFSVNAASRKVYRQIHGIDAFDTVIDNLKEYNNIIGRYPQSNAEIYLSFVAQKDNLSEIPHLLSIAADTRIANVVVRPILIGKFKNDNAPGDAWSCIERSRLKQSVYFCQETYEHYVEQAEALAKERGISFSCPDRFTNSDYLRHSSDCLDPWTTAHITVNGKVSFCCFHSALGDIKDSSFEDIWYSPGAERLRGTINGPGRNKICDTCWTHGRYTIDDPRFHFGEEIIKKFNIL